MPQRARIAIIGAGLCGLRVAQRLNTCAEVTVFEKSRGLGGRMATRRADAFQFDHGAQYFTVRDPGFQDFLAAFERSGTVARWQPRLATFGDGAECRWTAPRYVAVPAMNSLCKQMEQTLQIYCKVRIGALTETPEMTWSLQDEEGQSWGPFDWVVSTAPAVQTAELLPTQFAGYSAIRATKTAACYSLMLGGLSLDALDWDAAVVAEGPLAWIAVNHTKPGRAATSSVLCHSQNTWADAHIDDDPVHVQAAMTDALADLTGLRPEAASHTSLHKWRFAKTEDGGAGAPCFVDTSRRLAAAGDWCHGASVEAAFLSAESVSEKIIEQLQYITL